MRAHNGKFLYKIIAIQKKALLVPSGDSQLGLNGPLSEKKIMSCAWWNYMKYNMPENVILKEGNAID